MRTKNQENKTILSVSELNQFSQGCLEMHVGKVWVTGEVSNFSMPASGHWYFTLKDSQAQIRCAMFKGKNRFLRQPLKNGMQVLIQGNVSLYSPRGDYQMIVDYAEESGVGALQREFLKLKAKLEQQGLFDPKHKKPLPSYCSHIAVITSATGAAIADILHIAKKRQPNLRITVISTHVQGSTAASFLINALAEAEVWHKQQPIDAVIIGRGGGSLEDLWCFNDEHLAQAIFNFSLPIISAVGHEIDFSISDYVADSRAATPSQAAEMLSIEQHTLEQRLDDYERRLQQKCLQALQQKQQQLHFLRQRMRHPGERINQWQQQFEQKEVLLKQQMQQRLQQAQLKLGALTRAFSIDKLQQQNQQANQQLETASKQLHKAIEQKIAHQRQQLSQQAATLDMVSPLATLKRGYSITENEQGQLLKNSQSVTIGQQITTRLGQGLVYSQVTSTQNKQ